MLGLTPKCMGIYFPGFNYAKELIGKHWWLSREQAGLKHKGFTSTDKHVPKATTGWAGTQCVLRVLLHLGKHGWLRLAPPGLLELQSPGVLLDRRS